MLSNYSSEKGKNSTRFLRGSQTIVRVKSKNGFTTIKAANVKWKKNDPSEEVFR